METCNGAHCSEDAMMFARVRGPSGSIRPAAATGNPLSRSQGSKPTHTRPMRAHEHNSRHQRRDWE
jgi:hypothetical protein